MRKIIKPVAILKFYAMRGGTLVNGPVVAYLGAAQLQRHLSEHDAALAVFPLFCGLMLLSVLLGWIEQVSGIFGEEQRHTWLKNPAYEDIAKTRERIERNTR
tara:strand:+ start:388 stop:693 length:306 start_codon:yes stop_codon:yes gene_type:complete